LTDYSTDYLTDYWEILTAKNVCQQVLRNGVSLWTRRVWSGWPMLR